MVPERTSVTNVFLIIYIYIVTSSVLVTTSKALVTRSDALVPSSEQCF